MKPKKYTEEDLRNAITAINEGSSVYETSRCYHIPETTLRNKRDKKYENDKPGRKTILSKSEETKIVDWIHYLGKHGFPVSKEQLKQGVGKLVENLNRPNTFKHGIPGKHWLASFLSRHPTVVKRVAQTLPTHRNKITEKDVRSWFDRVQNYFKINNLLSVLEDESRIYNCDETAFFLCPKEKDVLVKKGSKRVYNRVANDEKECLTVLVNVSAGGKIAPPMVLYPYKRLPKNLPLTVPPTWGIGCTESGWMNMEAFYEYIANVFYKWLLDNKIEMPIVLFMDGHTSHISLPLSLFCKEKGIILVALLPNSTHLLQPLDVGVFRPIKSTWKNVVHEFRIKNNYAKLKRTDFAMEIQKCFEKSLKADTIKNSFRCTGIFPFNPNNINFTKVFPQEEDTAVISTKETSTDKSNGFFEEFEKRLAPEVLQLFVDSGSDWEGEERYRCLFEFWKKIQQEESPPTIFNDTTIVNNICDCDLSDVVANIEIGSNGSIILPLSPNPESIRNSDIAQLDQLLTPQINQSSDCCNTEQIETSLEHVIKDLSQPCCSRSLESSSFPESSRQSSNDLLLDNFNSVDDPNLKNADTLVENPPNKIENYPTPFKTAFFFPKSPKKLTTRQNKKITPTVAVADEFIEYQRRVAKEKKEKSANILKRRAERLKKQEERKSQDFKTIQKRNNSKKTRFTINKPTTSENIDQNIEMKGNIDANNKEMAFSQKRKFVNYVFNSDSSNDDEDVTLKIRNKNASCVKKTSTKLFGESTSDSSI